jgi:hypothetical protein
LGLACAYRAEHGHLNIPRNYRTANDERLGAWLATQRTRRKEARLPEDLAQSLEELGVLWDASHGDAGWWAAREWHGVHGHLQVPPGTVVSGVDLTAWIHYRRQERRTGRLPAADVEALDALGITWEPRVQRWQTGYVAASTWVTRHGHLTVPPDHEIDGLMLNAWLRGQRRAYRRGSLAKERVAALEALGIVWDPAEQDWSDGLADVADWIATNSHDRIPRSAVGRRVEHLGRWLENRRTEHRLGRLPQSRIKALEAVGVTFNKQAAASTPSPSA